MFRVILAGLVVAAGSLTGLNGAPTASACYSASSGDCVPDPTQGPAAPPGATAQCRDGDWSFSEHHSGTCSGHGGVAQWLKS
jgi:hypothetical protein